MKKKKKGPNCGLFIYFCNILDRISNFVNVHEKFCNKNLFFDLFNSVLRAFPRF